MKIELSFGQIDLLLEALKDSGEARMNEMEATNDEEIWQINMGRIKDVEALSEYILQVVNGEV